MNPIIVITLRKPWGVLCSDLTKGAFLGASPFDGASWWGLAKNDDSVFIGTNKKVLPHFWSVKQQEIRDSIRSVSEGYMDCGADPILGNSFGFDEDSIILKHQKSKPLAKMEGSLGNTTDGFEKSFGKYNDVHQTRYSKALGKIIMCCTEDDCLATFDPETFEIKELVNFSGLGRALGREKPSGKNSYFHLNSVLLDSSPYEDNTEDLYVNFHNHGKTESEIFVFRGLTREKADRGTLHWKEFFPVVKGGFCTHDLLLDSLGRLVTCDSRSGSLVAYDLKRGDASVHKISGRAPDEDDEFLGFSRGLVEHPGIGGGPGFFVVGMSVMEKDRTVRESNAIDLQTPGARLSIVSKNLRQSRACTTLSGVNQIYDMLIL